MRAITQSILPYCFQRHFSFPPGRPPSACDCNHSWLWQSQSPRQLPKVCRDFPVSKRLEGRLFMSPGGCVDQLEGHHCGGKLVVVRLVLDQHCPVAWPDGCCLSHENPKWHLVSLKLRDSASHRSKAEWLYLHVRPSVPHR